MQSREVNTGSLQEVFIGKTTTLQRSIKHAVGGSTAGLSRAVLKT